MTTGLVTLPGLADLGPAYDLLQHCRPSVPTAEQLALFSQWTRFDPRLGELWTKHVVERWEALDPMSLRAALQRQPWPAAAAVLLEFAERAISRSRALTKLFRLWKGVVTEGFAKANWEQYFIGQRRLAGKAMVDDARFALSEYKRWGYLGREIPFNKASAARARVCTIDSGTRLELLKALLESSPRITTRDYWNAIGRAVSRRQAERDLRNSPLLRPIGRTRGRCFARR